MMKKLLVWGIGKLTQQFMENGYHGEIVGFIQTKKSENFFMGKPVYGSDELPEIYDFIIVANSYTSEIYDTCVKLALDLSKVVFLHEMKRSVGCTDTLLLKELLLERNFTNYCIEFGLFENSFYEEDAKIYQSLNKRQSFEIKDEYKWPALQEKYAEAGCMGNYFQQDLWAARMIIRSGVKRHFDIGSRLDGFIAHLLAAEIDVTMIDIREFPKGKVEHLHTIVDDATTLHQIEDESIESMSALCSLEHFGLGRYGDPIDPEACFYCFSNIQKKLKKGGMLYLSVPVGKERVEFNAHRVFYANTIVECFSGMELQEYSCAADEKIEHNVPIHKYDEDIHNGEYRYGLFCFVKK